MKKKRKVRRTIQVRLGSFLFDLFLVFLTLTVIPVLIYHSFDPPTTALMWIRWAQNDYKPDLPRKVTQWVPIDRISPHLVKAVIASEDQKFFTHNGFDWQAIEYALKANLTTDRTFGASTISMQTARNAYLWQGRTWLRKSLETYFTFLIEVFWPKKRILEIYLNVIEWGEGIYGCENASQTYFKHSCKKLSPVESAWLAAILPNPRVWSIQNPQDHVQERQVRILNAMPRIRLPSLD